MFEPLPLVVAAVSLFGLFFFCLTLVALAAIGVGKEDLAAKAIDDVTKVASKTIDSVRAILRKKEHNHVDQDRDPDQHDKS